jgi:hypothetical protein
MAAFLCARAIVRGAAPMPRHAKPPVDSADGVRGRTGSPQPGTRTRARAWIQVAHVGAAAAGGWIGLG